MIMRWLLWLYIIFNFLYCIIFYMYLTKSPRIKLLLYLVLTLLLACNGALIPYQTDKQTIGPQCLFFYAKQDQQLRFQAVISQTVPQFKVNVLDASYDNFPVTYVPLQIKTQYATNKFIGSYSLVVTGYYIACGQINSNSYKTPRVIKLSAYVDNTLVKFEQFIGVGLNPFFNNRIIPVVTTKACQINFNLLISGIIYSIQVFNANQTDILSSPMLKPQTKNFDVIMLTPGTYFIVINHDSYYISDLKNYTATITTYSSSPCSNICFDKNPDLQMVPGTTTGECMCNPSLGYYLNPTSSLCDCIDINCKQTKTPPAPVCGNSVIQTGQKCDNGNSTGCLNNCVPNAGYTCTGALNTKSSCFKNVCGDKFLGNGEQCDNGNQTGCDGCKFAIGFICTGNLGQASTCIQKCGDGIKTLNEQCDNGNKTGCIDCKIGTGFNCIQGLYSNSLCYEICGNGIRTASEACDNKNSAGCESNCQITPGYSCNDNFGQASNCQIKCGDGVVGGSEKCDNGNKDGCTSNCVPDAGYLCKGKIGAVSNCFQICGDGIRTKNEKCDNGKKAGCLTCSQYDNGFTCSGDLGKTSICTASCGDKIWTTAQGCDNGNSTGCSSQCKPDTGYICTGSFGSASTCNQVCGDQIKVGAEQCDNGNRIGCQNCKIDEGYECKQDSIGKFSICTKK